MPARNDLKQIYDYIAKDSRYYATNVVENVVSKAENLDEFPEIGRVVPEISDKNVRELIIYSYRLIFIPNLISKRCAKSDHVNHMKKHFSEQRRRKVRF